MQALRQYLGLALVLLGLALAAPAAQAKTIPITVEGVTYYLTAAPLSYTANAALLQAQPWWGDEALSFAISEQLLYQLGDLEGGPGTTPGIPSALLAYGTDAGFVSITYWDGSRTINCPVDCPSVDSIFVYVSAQSTANSVPTLSAWGLVILVALMGPAALFALRRARRRA